MRVVNLVKALFSTVDLELEDDGARTLVQNVKGRRPVGSGVTVVSRERTSRGGRTGDCYALWIAGPEIAGLWMELMGTNGRKVKRAFVDAGIVKLCTVDGADIKALKKVLHRDICAYNKLHRDLLQLRDLSSRRDQVAAYARSAVIVPSAQIHEEYRLFASGRESRFMLFEFLWFSAGEARAGEVSLQGRTRCFVEEQSAEFSVFIGESDAYNASVLADLEEYHQVHGKFPEP